ncbi:protein of unknown function [Taphrina deformans PYCC 5710]|uniref:Uncharacterized protein n=1 Tax=Taphrina deformans (strain PYCC 5710 / ATCC 11124 / CBS 356.35 / IMI 108563 / JCM 9778 / NBRC 8474) TaxID=1097556 RepID=R4XDN2_TAPDE|nr:protein of unknown function [Taphrina deformans PYCC 5710]|eukprot:CCG83945.1 protein of unknown function [Taphrina deformans PYCC 5710]
MNTGSRKRSQIGSTQSYRSSVNTRTQLVSVQVECLYGLERNLEPASPSSSGVEEGAPVLIRYLRCRASLPNGIAIQNASRVIAMLKCFRKLVPAGRGANSPSIETIFSRFTRVWPKESSVDGSAPSSPTTNALVVHDSTNTVDFTIVLPTDLPQSVSVTAGSIYYTLQIQANVRDPGNFTSETVLYSQEITVDVPAPEAAYSASRLPKRITNGVVGQAQDHYGILITPDISLHVSVPREILYSKRQHSVFKIHIKLMPHPPEAKLPGIAKLEWKLAQRTNLANVHLERNSVPRRNGVSTADIASGQITLPAVKGGSSSEEAMSRSRKDQYIYIALPENSPALLPMYDGNRYLEILHSLEIELFPTANDAYSSSSASSNNNNNNNHHGGSGSGGNTARTSNNFTKSAASFFNKTFSRSRRESGTGKQPWKADIPIKLYFDPTEIPRRASMMSLNGALLARADSERLSIAA